MPCKLSLVLDNAIIFCIENIDLYFGPKNHDRRDKKNTKNRKPRGGSINFDQPYLAETDERKCWK